MQDEQFTPHFGLDPEFLEGYRFLLKSVCNFFDFLKSYTYWKNMETKQSQTEQIKTKQSQTQQITAKQSLTFINLVIGKGVKNGVKH